jgi:hypothetical protein
MKNLCISKSELNKYVGQRVYVFKEIKNQVWTVWDEARKEKLFWTNAITLTDAQFFVDQNKRTAVIKTQKRMPHAGVFGTIQQIQEVNQSELCYNPFLMKEFQNKKNQKPIKEGKIVFFSECGKVFGEGLK